MKIEAFLPTQIIQDRWFSQNQHQLQWKLHGKLYYQQAFSSRIPSLQIYKIAAVCWLWYQQCTTDSYFVFRHSLWADILICTIVYIRVKKGAMEVHKWHDEKIHFIWLMEYTVQFLVKGKFGVFLPWKSALLWQCVGYITRQNVAGC